MNVLLFYFDRKAMVKVFAVFFVPFFLVTAIVGKLRRKLGPDVD